MMHHLCVANEITPGFELDADIAAMCDACPTPPSPYNWACCNRDDFYSNFVAIRSALDIQSAAILEATSCGYLATASRTRAYRHACYSAGTMTPPVRATADDRARAEAVRWGFVKTAA